MPHATRIDYRCLRVQCERDLNAAADHGAGWNLPRGEGFDLAVTGPRTFPAGKVFTLAGGYSLNDGRQCRCAQFILGHAIGAFDDSQSALNHIQYTKIGYDPVNDALTGQRQGATLQHF